MLELRGVSKRYGATEVVAPLDLVVQAGEFFSLLGPSGCGKTTLLRMIAGFEAPTRGEVWLGTRRIDQEPPHHRQFNLVFQRYALFPHLSVEANVEFGLEMKRVPPAERRVRVREALELVQMAEFGARMIGTLSGGQQQRVAVARALVNRPKILLLDEPLSALDLKLRQQMQVELLALQRRLGTTFIFVTHDQEEALTLSNRIAVMSRGRVEQVGSPQEIYEYPRTPFVARFIGQMNWLTGEVREANEQSISVLLAKGRRPVVLRPSRDGLRPLAIATVGSRVRVLVRPEKVRVLKSLPGSDQNGLEGIITEVLYHGPLTHLLVQVREPGTSLHGVTIQAVQQNSAVTAKRPFTVGDRAVVAWAPEDCLLMPLSDEEGEGAREPTPPFGTQLALLGPRPVSEGLVVG